MWPNPEEDPHPECNKVINPYGYDSFILIEGHIAFKANHSFGVNPDQLDTDLIRLIPSR